MIRAVQHIPNFVDGVEPKRAEVETQAELLAVPWIASWAESTPEHEATDEVTSWPDGVKTVTLERRHVPAEIFHRWSVSDHGNGQVLLMCERDNGRWWWVVARLSGDLVKLSLPRWAPPET